MIDFDKMRRAVVTGLSKYLGCSVIRSNQNENSPDYPYVSYTITTLMSENKGTYGEYTDGKVRKPFTQVWSITVLSKDNTECINLVNKAHEWLDYAGKNYLNDNDVIVQSVGSVTNRDNFLTVDYEYRNGFDTEFLLMNEIEAEKETIETVNLKNIEY